MSQGNGLEEGDCPLGLQVLRIAMGEPAVLDTPPIPLHFDSLRQGSPILTMCYVQGLAVHPLRHVSVSRTQWVLVSERRSSCLQGKLLSN